MKLIDSLLLPGRDFYRRYCLPECFWSRRARANACIIPNSNARQDARSAAHPDDITNGRGSRLSSAKCKGTVTSGFSKPARRVYRMKSGIDLNVRCGRRIIVGRYFIVILKGTVSIDFAVVSAVHKKRAA